MSVKQSQYITIACDNPGCEHTVTFAQTDAQEVGNENPWMKTGRGVQAGGGQQFWYCSDQCEIGGITTGQHNPAEKKRLVTIDGNNAAAVKQAAAQAAAQEAATKAIKAGQPAQVTLG